MDQREESRQKCKTDPLYLGKCLGYDFQEDVHKPLFDLLLKFHEAKSLRDLSEIKNRLVLWPRGHFKTSAMVVFIVQLILNYPDIRILIMQANQRLGKLWLREIKSHFLTTGTRANTKSMLPLLFPEFCAPVLGDAMEFTVPARQRKHLPAATVTVASTKAANTGQHYDVFFPDDLVNQKNYRSVELLDQLWDDFNLFIPLIDPGGYTFMTGTRYHHADLYGRVIRANQGEWVVSVRGCSLTGKWPITDENELLFPVRETADGRKIGFTKALLEKIAADSPEMFWAQYFNQIVAGHRQIFPEKLILSSVRSSDDKAFPTRAPTVFFIDLAEGKRADSDHSVIAVGRQSGNTIWITDCIGHTFSTYELAITLISLTLKHRPIRIIVAKEPGAVHFVEYAKVLAREKGIVLPIMLQEKASRHKDAKKIRIEALESRVRTKQLFLVAGIPNFDRLLEEFTQFPKGEHDDRPDAIAMLVEFFSQSFIEVPRGPKLPWFVTQEAPAEASDDDPLTLGGVLIE